MSTPLSISVGYWLASYYTRQTENQLNQSANSSLQSIEDLHDVTMAFWVSSDDPYDYLLKKGDSPGLSLELPGT